MLDATIWPLWLAWTAFALAVLAIGVAGTRLTAVADQLADRTGLGEAVFGAVFIGASTSLPGITVSFVAGVDGKPELAASNALGGIVAQTAFLAVADVFYRKANLEHAAASSQNLVQAVLLVALLALVVVGFAAPQGTIAGVHPITLVLVLAYVAGLRLLRSDRERPMWHPRQTALTREDEPDPPTKTATSTLWIRFAALVPVLLMAGVVVERTAAALGPRLGIGDGVTGAVLTAIPTSLPELVIAVAAVRRGALTLAVGDVLGGNAFDTLFLAAADAGYRGGSVYQDAGGSAIFLAGMSIVLNAILLLGFLRREPKGPANIGSESVLVLVGVVATYVILFLA